MKKPRLDTNTPTDLILLPPPIPSSLESGNNNAFTTKGAFVSEAQQLVDASLKLLQDFVSPQESERRIVRLEQKLLELNTCEQDMFASADDLIERYGRHCVMKDYQEVLKVKKWVQANLDLARAGCDRAYMAERLDTYHAMLESVPVTETNERTSWQWYARIFDLRVAEAIKLNKDQCSHCHKPFIALKKQAMLQCTNSACARAIKNLTPWSHKSGGGGIPYAKPITAMGAGLGLMSGMSSSSGLGQHSVVAGKLPNNNNNNIGTTLKNGRTVLPGNPGSTVSASGGAGAGAKRTKTQLARFNQFREGHALTPPKTMVDRIRTHMMSKDHINSATFKALPTPTRLAMTELDNPKIEEHWFSYAERIANLVNYVEDYLLTDAQIDELMSRLDEIQAAYNKLPTNTTRLHFYMNFFINRICMIKGWVHFICCFPPQKTGALLKDQHAKWNQILPELIKNGQHVWTIDQRGIGI